MLTGLIVYTLLFGFGNWESIGPDGGDIYCPVQSPTNPLELWSFAYLSPTYVMHSIDGGVTWKFISTINTYSLSSAVVTADGTLLVTATGTYLWRSTDRGLTWETISVPDFNIRTLAAHPSAANVVYGVGTTSGSSGYHIAFFKSTDNGSTFDAQVFKKPGTFSRGTVISVSHSNPSVILIGGYIFDSNSRKAVAILSVDGGNSFKSVISNAAALDEYLDGAAIHPTNPDIMLLGTRQGIYRTVNRGSSWTKAATQEKNYNLTFSLADNNLVLGRGHQCVQRSSDGGRSWSSVTAGLSGGYISATVPSWHDASVAFASTPDGFYRSSNGGVSWRSTPGLLTGRVLAMEESQNWVYMSIYENGMMRTSVFGSVDWKTVKTPLDCGDFCAISANGSGTILALEGVG